MGYGLGGHPAAPASSPDRWEKLIMKYERGRPAAGAASAVPGLSDRAALAVPPVPAPPTPTAYSAGAAAISHGHPASPAVPFVMAALPAAPPAAAAPPPLPSAAPYVAAAAASVASTVGAASPSSGAAVVPGVPPRVAVTAPRCIQALPYTAPVPYIAVPSHRTTGTSTPGAASSAPSVLPEFPRAAAAQLPSPALTSVASTCGVVPAFPPRAAASLPSPAHTAAPMASAAASSRGPSVAASAAPSLPDPAFQQAAVHEAAYPSASASVAGAVDPAPAAVTAPTVTTLPSSTATSIGDGSSEHSTSPTSRHYVKERVVAEVAPPPTAAVVIASEVIAAHAPLPVAPASTGILEKVSVASSQAEPRPRSRRLLHRTFVAHHLGKAVRRDALRRSYHGWRLWAAGTRCGAARGAAVAAEREATWAARAQHAEAAAAAAAAPLPAAVARAAGAIAAACLEHGVLPQPQAGGGEAVPRAVLEEHVLLASQCLEAAGGEAGWAGRVACAEKKAELLGQQLKVLEEVAAAGERRVGEAEAAAERRSARREQALKEQVGDLQQQVAALSRQLTLAQTRHGGGEPAPASDAMVRRSYECSRLQLALDEATTRRDIEDAEHDARAAVLLHAHLLILAVAKLAARRAPTPGDALLYPTVAPAPKDSPPHAAAAPPFSRFDAVQLVQRVAADPPLPRLLTCSPERVPASPAVTAPLPPPAGGRAAPEDRPPLSPARVVASAAAAEPWPVPDPPTPAELLADLHPPPLLVPPAAAAFAAFGCRVPAPTQPRASLSPARLAKPVGANRPPPPRQLVVSCPALPTAGGLYTLSEALSPVNRMPVWTSGDRCLYSGAAGRWLLGGNPASMAHNRGCVRSAAVHGGRLPHLVSGWEQADGSGGWFGTRMQVEPVAGEVTQGFVS